MEPRVSRSGKLSALSCSLRHWLLSSLKSGTCILLLIFGIQSSAGLMGNAWKIVINQKKASVMPKRGVLIFSATCIFTKSYRTLSKINKVNKKRQRTLAGEKFRSCDCACLQKGSALSGTDKTKQPQCPLECLEEGGGLVILKLGPTPPHPGSPP